MLCPLWATYIALIESSPQLISCNSERNCACSLASGVVAPNGDVHETHARQDMSRNTAAAVAAAVAIGAAAAVATPFICFYWKQNRIKKTLAARRDAAVPAAEEADRLPHLPATAAAAAGGEDIAKDEDVDDEPPSPRALRYREREARLERTRASEERAHRAAALRDAAEQQDALRGAAGRAVDGLDVQAAAIAAAACGAATPPGSPRALRNQIWTVIAAAAGLVLWICLAECLLRWLQ